MKLMKLTKKTLWCVVLLIVTNDQNTWADEGIKTEIDSFSRPVHSLRLNYSSNQVTVFGLVRRELPLGPTPGEHIDVQLMEAGGRVLAEKMDRVTERATPRHTTFHRQLSYAVSFPRKTWAAAAQVSVVYHLRPHRDCLREKKS
jgi:hypothetical protein